MAGDLVRRRRLFHRDRRDRWFELPAVTCSMGRLDQTLSTLSERMVTPQELDWRAVRSAEDRDRPSEIRSGTVSRAEWTERNRARDQEVTGLGRRVDEIRGGFGAAYGPET